MIFSHLTTEQLKELEGLGAQKALEILQGHIVRFLKEKMRSEGGGRGRGRGRGRGGKTGSRGTRKEGTSMPGISVDTKPMAKQEVPDQRVGALRDQPSVQSLTYTNETPQTNGADRDNEERATKKRKMEVLDVDVEVDVIGP